MYHDSYDSFRYPIRHLLFPNLQISSSVASCWGVAISLLLPATWSASTSLCIAVHTISDASGKLWCFPLRRKILARGAYLWLHEQRKASRHKFCIFRLWLYPLLRQHKIGTGTGCHINFFSCYILLEAEGKKGPQPHVHFYHSSCQISRLLRIYCELSGAASVQWRRRSSDSTRHSDSLFLWSRLECLLVLIKFTVKKVSLTPGFDYYIASFDLCSCCLWHWLPWATILRSHFYTHSLRRVDSKTVQ